jgi:hypothetical protein
MSESLPDPPPGLDTASDSETDEPPKKAPKADTAFDKPPKKKKALKMDTSNRMTVQAEYDLLAIDGEGKWRKETPAPDSARSITFEFPNPDDKVDVARVIRKALKEEMEPIRRPPMPNPERDFTELQWFLRDDKNTSLLGAPIRLDPLMNRMDIKYLLRYLEMDGRKHVRPNGILRLALSPIGRIVYSSTDNIGFIVKGNNPERLARVLKAFGATGEASLLVENGWQSPDFVNLNKTEELDPYNLTGPYEWWAKAGSKASFAFMSYDGSQRETVRIVSWKDNMSSVRYETYEDIRACTSIDALLRLLLPDNVEFGPHPDRPGLWQIKGSAKSHTLIEFFGIPCDIIPKAFGVDESRNPWGVFNNITHMHTRMYMDAGKDYTFEPTFEPCKVMSVGDIVRVSHDTATNSVMFEMDYSDHVQGFTIRFPRKSPFYASCASGRA